MLYKYVGSPLHYLVKGENDVISIQLEKIWSDAGAASSRPVSINVNIYRDKTSFKSVTLSSKEDWKASLSNLPKFHESGKAYAYTVREVAVNGYSSAQKVTKDGDNYLVTLTNTKKSVTPTAKAATTPNAAKSSKKTAGAKTGDETPVAFLATLLLCAGAAITLIRCKKKKTQ